MSEADDDGAGRPLARIARTLGVPVAAFFQPDDDWRSAEAEEAELVGLFRELRDRHSRRCCLDMVREMARPAGGTRGGRS